jgi:hypothetical protein
MLAARDQVLARKQVEKISLPTPAMYHKNIWGANKSAGPFGRGCFQQGGACILPADFEGGRGVLLRKF